jgi:hypothetical protein
MSEGQVAGRECSICRTRMVLASEGSACRDCDIAWHHQCRKAASCPSCGSSGRERTALPEPVRSRHQFLSDDFRMHFGSIGPYLPFLITSILLFGAGILGNLPFGFSLAALLAVPLGPIWSYITHKSPSLVHRPLVGYLCLMLQLIVPLLLGVIIERYLFSGSPSDAPWTVGLSIGAGFYITGSLV